MRDVFVQAGVLVAVGLAVLAIAAWLGSQRSAGPDGPVPMTAAPLVPWLGSLIAVGLAVRGSLAGAVIVLSLTVAHAVRVRWRLVVLARATGGAPRD